MRPFLLFLGTVLTICPIWSQNLPPKDSLVQIWQDSSLTDGVRFTAMEDLIQYHYLRQKPDSARILSTQLNEQAEQTDDLFLTARSYSMSAEV